MQLVLVRDQLHDPYTKGGDKGDEMKYLKIAQRLGAETYIKMPLNRTAPVLYCSLFYDWVLFLHIPTISYPLCPIFRYPFFENKLLKYALSISRQRGLSISLLSTYLFFRCTRKNKRSQEREEDSIIPYYRIVFNCKFPTPRLHITFWRISAINHPTFILISTPICQSIKL